MELPGISGNRPRKCVIASTYREANARNPSKMKSNKGVCQISNIAPSSLTSRADVVLYEIRGSDKVFGAIAF